MDGADRDIEDLIGTTVAGKYRIDALIGQGGMGAVLRATHLSIGKQVALKFLCRAAARDLGAVARFQREAEAASAVDDAHIVQIFDSGATQQGLPFLVMELLKGEDLRHRLERCGRLPLEEVVHIAGQVARALRSAHAAGIVHRDLKPDNVFLVNHDDDPTFVKLVDFGISKIARPTLNADTLTHQGVVLGTACYMAPEQARAERDLDGRTDLYSLGVIMYEALAGRPPHTGTAYEAVLIDICTRDAPDVRDHAPEVPEPMARLLARALRRDRERRFQSADEVYAALCEVAPGVLRPVTPTGGVRVRSIAPQQGRRRTTAVVGVVVLTAIAIAVFRMAGSREVSPPPPASAAAASTPSAPPAASVAPVPCAVPVVSAPPVRPPIRRPTAPRAAPTGTGVAGSLRLVTEP
jgi:serine/threonine-protein kinase